MKSIKSHTMYKYFLSAIILISFFSCRSIKDTGSSSFSDSESPYVNEEPKIKPVVKTEKAIIVKEEKVKVIEAKDNTNDKYFVIIGSFKVLINAKNYKNSLASEGFTPVILENESGLYRVSVAAYDEENDARNKVNDIRTEYEKYNDTWLLIRKL